MKVLVDSSVWIDHLHRANMALRELLRSGSVVTHQVVIGELACGTMRNRQAILADLRRLPTARESSFEEILHLVEANRLWGHGFGWSDAQLLASCRLESAALWTRDRALRNAARALAVSWDPEAAE